MDHVPLTIVIPIFEEHVQTKKHTTIKDSNEKHAFIKKLTEVFRNINTSNIVNITCLNRIINEFASSVENIWTKNSKIVNIMVHSKSW